MNIGIIGTGGVGGYYGGKLVQLIKSRQDIRVYFVARNEHLKVIQEKGLALKMAEGTIMCVPTLATDNISELPILDLCFICVKSFDLPMILDQLKSKITEQTAIMPLMNGIDITKRIRSVITLGQVYEACAYIGTHIEKPGTVVQQGGSCIIHFGETDNGNKISAGSSKKTDISLQNNHKTICQLFDSANIKYQYYRDGNAETWRKFTFIAGFGLVTAVYNKTMGEIMASDILINKVKSVMAEVVAVAGKMQIILPEHIIEDSIEKGHLFSYDTKTSFQRDYEKADKPDERDLYCGTIIRLGELVGADTQLMKKINDKLNSTKPQ